MNMQALLKQAQSMQKDMLKAQEEIESTIFTGESSIVKVEMKGNYRLESVKINVEDNFEKEDIEMLEDMTVIAINEAVDKIKKTTESKMAKFGNMPGLF